MAKKSSTPGAPNGAPKRSPKIPVNVTGETIDLGDTAQAFALPRSKYDQELDQLVAATKAASAEGKDPTKVGRKYTDQKVITQLKKRASDRGIFIQSAPFPGGGWAVRIDPSPSPVAPRAPKAPPASPASPIPALTGSSTEPAEKVV